MAMTADSISMLPTPTFTPPNNHTIPWAKIVCGEPETTPSPEKDDTPENDNADAVVKKPAWNKPKNGVVPVSPVMGAVSWPPLSECTKPSPKSPPDHASLSQGPVIPDTPQKQGTSNGNTSKPPKSASNNVQPVRQRSFKRGGGSGLSGFNRPLVQVPPPPMPPPFPVFEMPYANIWEARPMGPRGGGFGPRPRGNAMYQNGYGGRRENGGDWNGHRNSHHQMVRPPPRGFMRGPPPPPPPPGCAPFMNGRPFGNPMGYDMASPFFYVPAMGPEPFGGVPHIAQGPPPPPMFFPFPDPALPALIVKQIDYYFSDSNLAKDHYLRSYMDEQGWVPITLIASFPRVQRLTNNCQLILDSMRASIVVEVQGVKLRKRNEWQRWLPSSPKTSTTHSSQASTSSSPQSTNELDENMLANSLQKVKLDTEPTTTTNTRSDEPILANGVEGATEEEACGSNHI